MKKLVLLFIFVFCLTLNSVFAESVKSSINNVISQSSINKGAISVSVRDMSNGKTVYEMILKEDFSNESVTVLEMERVTYCNRIEILTLRDVNGGWIPYLDKY